MLTSHLSLRFNGPHDAIVQTLAGVAELMQREVDLRAERRRTTIERRPVETTAYLNAAAQQLRRLAVAFASAEKAFAAAGSPHGSPQALAKAYGEHLDAVLSVSRKMLSMQAPAKFAGISAGYADFLHAYYDRCASWPEEIRDAASSVRDNSVAIELVADYDMTAIERAINGSP